MKRIFFKSDEVSEKKYKTFELKAADEGNGIVEGYASTWTKKPDSYGDIVIKGAFTETIKKRKATGHPFPLCFNHDLDQIIGAVTEIEEDDYGLKIKASFLNTPLAQEKRELVKEGIVWQFSFAYSVLGWEAPTEEERSEGIYSKLTKLDLYEVSLVPVPANQTAVVTEVKNKDEVEEKWGSGGGSAGKMPLLEDGMEIKPYQFNAREAQYAETKQLSREDVAAAYHVNPSLIWHTSTQTYASAKDNARALYADCLGPTIQMLQQRINSFLLPMIGADPDTYVIFDLSEKLKGSFEERASILQSAVGAPYMTRNEARADMDLPPVDGGDKLVTPLNVNNGIDNPAVEEEEKKMQFVSKKEQGTTKIKGKAEDEENEEVSDAIKKFLKRQKKSILPKIGAKKEWWDEVRWNTELAEDLDPILFAISAKHGDEASDVFGTDYYPGKTVNYIKAVAEGRARAINTTTKEKLDELIDSEPEDLEEEIDHLFEVREEKDANLLGMSMATAVTCWALGEASRQAKDQGYQARVYKTWITGENPREDHAMMSGETVEIDQKFSNGADWPGDDILGPDGTCGCNCTTEVTIERK